MNEPAHIDNGRGTAFAAVPFKTAAVPHPFWTLARVAQALGTGPRAVHAVSGISTDTRTLSAGDVFVALVGENFDAHDFLHVARDRGASALVVSRVEAAVGLGLPTFVVPDTLVALGQLARSWRRAWGRTVVAVAGSNGKTSTKELIRAALTPALEVHATRGNLNNRIGVPLTLLSIPSSAQIAVVEVGTNSPGEIEKLRAIVEPDIAVMTSIGEEHLEGLGDLAGVLREESAVFDGVDLAIVPTAYPEVATSATGRARQIMHAGLVGGHATPSSWGLTDDGRGWLVLDDVRIELPMRGAHQVANAMLALAVAHVCGVTLAQSAAGLAAMPVPSMRGVWQPMGDAILLNDAYNANPASMRAALALLSNVGAGRQRVAILGSMRELGPQSRAQHEGVARDALASSADLIVGVGEFADAFRALAPNDSRVLAVTDFDDLWPPLASRLDRRAVILLKASRGMQLERLIPHLSAWATA